MFRAGWWEGIDPADHAPIVAENVQPGNPSCFPLHGGKIPWNAGPRLFRVNIHPEGIVFFGNGG